MTRVCAAALLACAIAAGARAAALPVGAPQAASRDTAWRHFETWYTAIASHEPGQTDDAVRAMLAMRAQDLEAAFPYMVLTLVRAVDQEDRRVKFDTLFERYLPSRAARDEFTPEARDALTRRGDTLAAGGVTRFLKRAAALHADIALVAPAAHLTLRRGSGYLVNDGRGAGDEGRPWHWMLGRAFLHLVPNAARDREVRIWYQAVGTHLWTIRTFTEAMPHIRQAVELFPRDAEIQFVRGLVHESLGAPHIQAALEAQTAAVRAFAGRAMRPPSTVAAREIENRDAREAFRKAVDAAPDHHEARIRLARGMSLDGRHERAAAELRIALAATGDRRLQYFAQLFLGRAEEARRRLDAARAAYEAAAALYPEAQSPRLALSQLALRTGAREGAAELFAVLTVPSREDADPWWSYHYERVPASRVWMSRMWHAFREAIR